MWPLTEGCHGFASTSLELGIAKITGSDANGLRFEIETTLTNPSDITTSAQSELSFHLKYNDIIIGNIGMHDLSLHPGKTMFKAHGYITADPSDQQAVKSAREVLSQFSRSQKVFITWSGIADSMSIPVLKTAVSGLQWSGEAPGIGKQLISKSAIKWGMFGWLKRTIKADVYITNRSTF